MNFSHFSFCCILLLTFISCNTKNIPEGTPTNQKVEIFPCYQDVTIPLNIAPLNFELKQAHKKAWCILEGEEEQLAIEASKGQFQFPIKKWKKFIFNNKGKSIKVNIIVLKEDSCLKYPSFPIHISCDSIDSHIAFRLISPGYMLWNKMGIYQRNLENYQRTPIFENRLSDHNCINCHSFCNQDPDKFLFHARSKHSGTILIDGERKERLSTKTKETIGALTYPSWHPSGRFIAFSINNVKQAFHYNNPNRIEVFDLKSDVAVYDIKKHQIISSSSIYSPDKFETFPTFSPDGKHLYFAAAKGKEMPLKYDSLHYNICSIEFDPSSRHLGNKIDTIYNAEINKKSASMPRISPDGKFLLFSKSNYGQFTIWHQDSDLHMIDLKTKKEIDMTPANSSSTESYHSWSHNSRWIVFSSRRIDNLYTRPYIAHVSASGEIGKAFLLPQEDVSFYTRLMKSYNIPEFTTGKVKLSPAQIAQIVRTYPAQKVTFQKQ